MIVLDTHIWVWWVDGGGQLPPDYGDARRATPRAGESAMTDEKALWAAVRAAPADDLPKLVLADYLDEADDRSTAAALRWRVARGRWPRVTQKRRFAVWNAGPPERPVGRPVVEARAVLPLAFWVTAEGCVTHADLERVPTGLAFRSLERAIMFVGDALARLRALASDTPDA